MYMTSGTARFSPAKHQYRISSGSDICGPHARPDRILRLSSTAPSFISSCKSFALPVAHAHAQGRNIQSLKRVASRALMADPCLIVAAKDRSALASLSAWQQGQKLIHEVGKESTRSFVRSFYIICVEESLPSLSSRPPHRCCRSVLLAVRVYHFPQPECSCARRREPQAYV